MRDLLGRSLGVPVDACTPNLLVQAHITRGEGHMKEPFTTVDGYAPLPTRSGFGVELEAADIADKLGHDWKNPHVWHDDDAVADW